MATKEAFQEELNPFAISKQQFNRAADFLELDSSLRHVLESPKRQLFRQFAAIAKAVAHEHRLELLEALAQGERSVETLANCVGMSIATFSGMVLSRSMM